MFDLFTEIRQTLSTNRLRTLLTGISVAWGIFILIILVAMSRGVYNGFEDSSSNRILGSIEVYSGTTTLPFKGYKPGRYVRPSVQDLPEIIATRPDIITDVQTSLSIDTAKVETPTDYTSQGLQGVFPESQDTKRLKLVAGRMLNHADNRECRKSIMLESRNAELLFGSPEAAIGQTVKSLGLAWTVVGVFQLEWDRSNYVPFNTLYKITNSSNIWRVTVVAPGMDTEEKAEQLNNDIKRTMARLHDYDPSDNGGMWIYNRFTDYISSQQGLRVLDIAIWVVGILTMLSGIIGVSNIMFVSVRERTHEIGIRRAIGAKPRSIMLQVVMESVAITTIFGYIGVVLGMVVTQIADHIIASNENLSMAIKNPTVDISIAIKVTIVLIISGAIAGLVPAIKATKVKPVEALRDE